MYAQKPLPVKTGPRGQRLAGLRLHVLGVGKSGLSAVDLCLSEGAQVTAFDEKTTKPSSLEERGVRLRCGPFTDDVWHSADALVVSPGVPLATPAIARAISAGTVVVGEVELAMNLLLPSPPLAVGITGTNGKSTTTALAGELFRRQYPDVFVGGNLGRPLSDAALAPHGAYVVELSSFQLEGIVEARFQGAAFLNLTPDHLDRYASTSAYAAAKARIWANQSDSDFVVVNAEDAQVMEWARTARSRVFGFSSGTAPLRPGPRLEGLARATEEGFEFLFGEKPSFRVDNRALRGAHNKENAMAAALLAHLSGVRAELIEEGLKHFPGLAHRLESVRVLDGVEWINDSKATNVDSSVMALRALKGPLWLIAGGKGKGAPYGPLVEAAAGKVKGVLTVGADAPNVEAAFSGVCPVYSCQTLERAVHQARALAVEGDMVLLSPACASYDQFQHFEDRGDRFKAWVRAL